MAYLQDNTLVLSICPYSLAVVYVAYISPRQHPVSICSYNLAVVYVRLVWASQCDWIPTSSYAPRAYTRNLTEPHGEQQCAALDSITFIFLCNFCCIIHCTHTLKLHETSSCISQPSLPKSSQSWVGVHLAREPAYIYRQKRSFN